MQMENMQAPEKSVSLDYRHEFCVQEERDVEKWKNICDTEKSNKYDNVGSSWRKFGDSDDGTSEGYEDLNDDSDDDDDDDDDVEHVKGISDIETINLLDEAGEDEDDDDVDGNQLVSEKYSDGSMQSKNVSITPIKIVPRMEPKTLKSSFQQDANIASTSSLYEITSEQQKYYTKCFSFLVNKTTDSTVDISAICGTNEHVVNFFERSNLDRKTLSKVWSLSDVNGDGWLNLAEFSIAMHLIVLFIKGNLPIPDVLPEKYKPPITPARLLPVLNNVSPDRANTFGFKIQQDGIASWRQFDITDSVRQSNQVFDQMKKQYSLNSKSRTPVPENHETERMRLFSDVPPLLVDDRPTALKATQPLICSSDSGVSLSIVASHENALKLALSPVGPKGPPPKPPPRPANKGHGRSASLDLKNVNLSRGISLKPSMVSEDHLSSDHSLPVPSSYQQELSLQYKLSKGNRLPCDVQDRLEPASFDERILSQIDRELIETVSSGCTLSEDGDIVYLGKEINELLSLDVRSICDSEIMSEKWKRCCLQLSYAYANLKVKETKIDQLRVFFEQRLQEVSDAVSAKKPTAL